MSKYSLYKISKKFSHEAGKSFVSTRKKFQAHNIIDINNKSNISRSSESEVLKNVHEENKPVHKQEQIEQEQAQGEPPLALSCQESQGTLLPSTTVVD